MSLDTPEDPTGAESAVKTGAGGQDRQVSWVGVVNRTLLTLFSSVMMQSQRDNKQDSKILQRTPAMARTPLGEGPRPRGAARQPGWETLGPAFRTKGGNQQTFDKSELAL